MLKIGLIIIAVSVLWYIVHAVIYNYYLQKYNPDLFKETKRSGRDNKKRREVQVLITSGQTPAWVMLLGMPPIPLFIIGVLVTIIGFIISLFK